LALTLDNENAEYLGRFEVSIGVDEISVLATVGCGFSSKVSTTIGFSIFTSAAFGFASVIENPCFLK
jgi:hypothetical protein